MRTSLTALACLVLLGVSSAYAVAAGQSSQQQKCETEAQTQGLVGDIRASYVKMCMEPINTSPAREAKLKECHSDAAAHNYHGEELSRFVVTCMTQ